MMTKCSPENLTATRAARNLYDRAATMNKGIVMHQKYLSSSDLTSYINCPRKAIMQIRGFRFGQSDAQKRGTELHSAVEAYLKGESGNRVNDPLGDFARQNGFLPEPNNPRVKVELGLGIPNADAARYADVAEWTNKNVVIAGVPIRGMVDLIRADRKYLEIIDHKTVANFYWAETAESLRANIQLWMYAYLVMTWANETGFASIKAGSTIRLAHIQYAKGVKPSANAVREVAFETSATEVVRRWTLIKNLIKAIVADDARQLRTVAANRKHCDAYSGCPFAGFCLTLEPSDLNPESMKALNDWLSL